MTCIILIIDAEFQAVWTGEDPRPAQEIMIAINTRKETVQPPGLHVDGERQWAQVHLGIETVTVVLQTPPVELTPRQYQVLFGLAEGKPAGEIAAGLGISRRMVYQYTAELKERFQLWSVMEVLQKASDLGMIED